MKTFIASLLFLIPNMVQATTYELDSSFTDSGKIKVRFIENKGSTIFYPKSVTSKITEASSTYYALLGGICNDLDSKIDRINKIQGQSEKARKIVRQLYSKNDMNWTISYFPFSSNEFFAEIKTGLQKAGISNTYGHFRLVDVEIEKIELIAEPDALVEQIRNYEWKKELSSNSNSSSLFASSKFLPLACDIRNKSVSIKIHWNLKQETYNSTYKELMTKDEISTVYTELSNLQYLLESEMLEWNRKTDDAFLQGALLGNAFQKVKGKLSKENIYAFKTYFQIVFNSSDVSLKTMNQQLHRRLSNSLTIDLGKEVFHQQGVSNVR